MGTSQELKKAAAETASAAAEYGQTALRDGFERAQTLFTEARDQAGPILHDAKVRTADYASRRLEDLEPHLKDALEKVTPAVDAARERLAEELLPKLQEALHTAAEHPAVAAASKHGEAAVQALAGELESRPKRGRLRKVGKFLAITAIVAGAVAAVRHFLAPKDDGWTAHEPSKAYVPNNDTFSSAARFATEAPAEDQEVVGEKKGGEEQATGQAEQPYGEGSYVGPNPPEGYTIKGNKRSNKYHLVGTGGYERTIAEVWFNSEEAAQAAGFTKAQR